ncbi:MAG: universal stress protein [Acidimicrobiia bacterium]|nr:universal stress protein [Acidimicrobiia bacterium]
MATKAAAPTNIVVGTDGSDTACRALDRAAALAAALDAKLHVVSAYAERPGGVPSASVASLDAGWSAGAKSGAEKVVAEAEERARAAGVTHLTGEAVGGDPAEALLRAASERGADLLVVGSKGMQSTARFLLGPIANKVSRRVECDLLIVETSEGG